MLPNVAEAASGFSFVVLSDLHFRDVRCGDWLEAVVKNIRELKPQPAFVLLNGDLSNDLAQAFARRLTAESSGDLDQLVVLGYRLALGRPPTEAERQLSLRFVRQQPLSEFALALFNLNGFLYVP